MAAVKRRPAGWLRQEIVAALLASSRPLSAKTLEEICTDGGSTIHYSAVLRALDELVSTGLIARIALQRTYLPAAKKDKLTLVCARCGEVTSLSHDPTIGLDRLAQAERFKPDRYIVEVSGICVLCAC